MYRINVTLDEGGGGSGGGAKQLLKSGVTAAKKLLPKFLGGEKKNGGGGRSWQTIKRFSEFDKLLQRVKGAAPERRKANGGGKGGVAGLPRLPEKKMFGRMDEAFVVKRQQELEHFLQALLAIQDAPAVTEIVMRFLSHDLSSIVNESHFGGDGGDGGGGIG